MPQTSGLPSSSVAVRSALVTFVIAIAYTVVAGVVIWRLRYLLSPNLVNAANANPTMAVAGALALIGVLMTAGVTLVGLLFQRSISMESARKEALAERRLNMEAAMSAVKVLCNDEGKSAPDYQSSAMLSVLAELGHLSIALDLATELWPRSAITRRCAVNLLDQAIESDEESLQKSAARLLNDNWSRLILESDDPISKGSPDKLAHSWPSSLEGGAPSDAIKRLREVVSAVQFSLQQVANGSVSPQNIPALDFREQIQTSGKSVEAVPDHVQGGP